MNAKDIYLLHEYGDESHFKALYDYSELYGFNIKGMVVLSKYQIIKRFVKKVLNGNAWKGLLEFFRDVFLHCRIHFVSECVMIVGIAPYDNLLNKYSKIIKKNKSFYFTSWPYWDGSLFPKGSLKNKSLFENVLSRSFCGAFCVNSMSADQLQNIIQPISVVGHSIRINEYTPKKENLNFPLKFVFIGSFEQRKNIPLLLNWIKKSKEKFEFYFIGNGLLRKDIELLAKIDHRVHLVGYVSKQNLKQMLHQYDFLILPSQEEPFGIVLIEAFASGIPCIVSDAPGPKDIVRDGKNGFVFKLTDSEINFCKVMNKIFSLTKDDIRKLRANALKDGLKYDSKKIAQKWFKQINAFI